MLEVCAGRFSTHTFNRLWSLLRLWLSRLEDRENSSSHHTCHKVRRYHHPHHCHPPAALHHRQPYLCFVLLRSDEVELVDVDQVRGRNHGNHAVLQPSNQVPHIEQLPQLGLLLVERSRVRVAQRTRWGGGFETVLIYH